MDTNIKKELYSRDQKIGLLLHAVQVVILIMAYVATGGFEPSLLFVAVWAFPLALLLLLFWLEPYYLLVVPSLLESYIPYGILASIQLFLGLFFVVLYYGLWLIPDRHYKRERTIWWVGRVRIIWFAMSSVIAWFLFFYQTLLG